MDKARTSRMDLKPTIVIDDIIPEDLQNQYHDLIMSRREWGFIKDMSYSNGYMRHPSYGFNMMFKHPDFGTVSSLYEQVSVPIIEFVKQKTSLPIKDIVFNRAFLQVPLDSKFVKEHNVSVYCNTYLSKEEAIKHSDAIFNYSKSDSISNFVKSFIPTNILSQSTNLFKFLLLLGFLKPLITLSIKKLTC